ncbi:MAG: hypothetical protein WCL00_09735 [Bacteroidota bacterium]
MINMTCKKPVSVFISIILVFTLSCKKKEASPSSSIVFGNSTGMFVRIYDTLIARAELTYMRSFEFDVNNDNINDFKLVSFNLSGNSSHSGIQNGASICSLNKSSSLQSYLETDTLFFNIITDTTFQGSNVNILIQYASSCSRIASDDSIIKIWNQNKIIERKSGDHLSTSERFISDSITITRAENSSWTQIIHQNQDTTICSNSTYLDKCNSITNEKILYLGIRIGDKLGWIKLLIMEDYKILLLESAIEY